jgi:hypothetical protein
MDPPDHLPHLRTLSGCHTLSHQRGEWQQRIQAVLSYLIRSATMTP